MQRKPQAVIFDLDGTLADCDHRRPFLVENPPDWRSFYESMIVDQPNYMVLAWARTLSELFDILIVTGRPEEYRSCTMEWLVANGVPYTDVFMRPDGDFRRDSEVKREIYRNEIEDKYEVKLVVDDRSSVVEMWRSLGLECWQVADGNF